MPRDGSGNYTAPVNSVDPAVSGTTISPTDFNTLINDLSTEMTDSLDRSGKGAMLAALAMGGFKITNIGAPLATTDAARLTDLTLGGDVGGTLAANVVNKIQGTTVTGVTGTGKNVFDTSPTIATPSLTGAALTGVTTIAGLTSGAAPSSPNIGQQSAPRNGGGVSSNTPASIVSLSIPAGNWLVIAQTNFASAGGAIVTNFEACISSVNNSFTPIQTDARIGTVPLQTANINWWPGHIVAFLNISGTATYYVVANAVFSSGTLTVNATLNILRIS